MSLQTSCLVSPPLSAGGLSFLMLSDQGALSGGGVETVALSGRLHGGLGGSAGAGLCSQHLIMFLLVTRSRPTSV